MLIVPKWLIDARSRKMFKVQINWPIQVPQQECLDGLILPHHPFSQMIAMVVSICHGKKNGEEGDSKKDKAGPHLQGLAISGKNEEHLHQNTNHQGIHHWLYQNRLRKAKQCRSNRQCLLQRWAKNEECQTWKKAIVKEREERMVTLPSDKMELVEQED